MWHLVETRDSVYVAQKFLKMWVRHYGIPDCVVHDQGGEFEGRFTQFLEEFAIHSRVMAARAGCC